MNLHRLAMLTATLAMFAQPVMPASLDQIDVEREQGLYTLVAETHMAASAVAIYNVLLDYDDDRFERISSVYKESGYLPADTDGTPLVYTRLEGCLLFFCRSMTRVERLEVDAPYFIRTTALPERSDFRHARSEWTLEPDADGTKVTYRLEIEPDFHLPPFVGPWFLKRFLARGGGDAITQIERLAQDLDSTKHAASTEHAASSERAAPTEHDTSSQHAASTEHAASSEHAASPEHAASMPRSSSTARSPVARALTTRAAASGRRGL